jgi:hypothetical protein
MCCITTLVLIFAPRVGIIFTWLTNQQIFNLAFGDWNFLGSIVIPTWVWPVVGFIFLPWTTLAYLLLFPGGIEGIKWIVLGVALLIDLAGHGGTYRHRGRVMYRRHQTA